MVLKHVVVGVYASRSSRTYVRREAVGLASTAAPSFITANVRHELTRTPSTSTVHAPHWP
jgi:hypothetical protein